QEVFFRCRQRRGQQLQGDVAAQLQVVRLIDLAHAARAERDNDFEAADDSGAWSEWHGAVLRDPPHSPEVPGQVWRREERVGKVAVSAVAPSATPGVPEDDQAARVVVPDGEYSVAAAQAIVASRQRYQAR